MGAAQWLQDQLNLPSARNPVEQYFISNPNVNFATLNISLDDSLSFSSDDPDLLLAFGKVNMSTVVSIKVERGGDVTDLVLSGDLTDLYDFNFDDPNSFSLLDFLVNPGASVQAGYNTLGNGGRVFKSQVHLQNVDFPGTQFYISLK